MRHIPEYYYDERDPEFRALPQKTQRKLLKRCADYKKDVIAAIEKAYEEHIHISESDGLQPYSRTWGKS